MDLNMVQLSKLLQSLSPRKRFKLAYGLNRQYKRAGLLVPFPKLATNPSHMIKETK